MAYFIANESVPLEPSYAKPAWACTGCFGCREHCDHRNDVTGTLFQARSALVSTGQAPDGVTQALARFDERASALGRLSADPRVSAVGGHEARVAVLVGCEYARRDEEAGVDAIRAVGKLAGGPVAVVDVCCGAPLLYAGDRARFVEQGERFARAVAGKDRVVVADAGCAATLRVHHGARPGEVKMPTSIVHLSELAAREVARLGHLPIEAGSPETFRWHDPCQLGRGLGVYDAPRQVLSRLLGRAPAEFERRREDARCSGAGGLLPVTMPSISREIAHQRVVEHRRSGGGTIVTACASSKRALSRGGADVIDLATLILRGLEAGE
jgi:Fe-S oxidoreductase